MTAAYGYIPNHFAGPHAVADFIFSMQTLLALNKTEEARNLIPKAKRLAKSLHYREQRAGITSSIAAYHSMTHEWAPAIQLRESARDDRIMFESAVFGLINLHLQRTLEVCQLRACASAIP